jgi:hypothetical protein
MSFKPQPFFQYEQLDKTKDSFRLCRLLPAEPEAPINCELIHGEISSEKEKYLALSYTWGERSEQRWIRLNGQPFHVRPNLLQALKAIRKCDTPLVLWIDAICINQYETLEKNYQVSVMGSIYKNASTVLAWLGPEADNSDLVFDYFDDQDAKSHLTSTPSQELSEPHEATSLEFKRMHRRWNDESLQKAFKALICRSYWRRAWIK